MDLISIAYLIIIFALIGFLVYLVITYIPMPEPFKQTIIVGVVVLIVLYLLFVVASHQVVLHR